MATWISLNTRVGSVPVNMDNVTYILPAEEGSKINFDNQNRIVVTESPDAILDLIKK